LSKYYDEISFYLTENTASALQRLSS